MKLSPENYYSDEANKAYFSASQIKAFKKCEASAMAEINGEYERPASTALIVGGFVDAALTGADAEMEAFMKVHPEMFKRDGTLKADFVQAEWMTERRADTLALHRQQSRKQSGGNSRGDFERARRLGAVANHACQVSNHVLD